MNKKQYIQELLPVGIAVALIPFGLWILAVPYVFFEKWDRKQAFSEIGFTFNNIFKNICRYWWLVLLPVIASFVSVFLAKAFLPDLFEHIVGRVSDTLVLNKILVLIPQFAVLAFAEEIVFRAFIQRKLMQFINPIWAIVITAVIFSVGHFSYGSAIVVLFDLLWVFFDGLVYGILFYKTRNVYICSLSHFLANVIIFLLLLILNVV